MVNKLTSADETAIHDRIQQIEQRTTATIRLIVLPSSDHYQDFILLYGLILGSATSCALWAYSVLTFPQLLIAQLGVIILVDLIPWFRRLCIRLVPRHVRYHRAAEAAHRDYLLLHAEISKEDPFALLFVSLAERYVHVITNPVIHKKMPDNWNAITERFIELIRTEGLRTACVQSLEHMAEKLALHFPKN